MHSDTLARELVSQRIVLMLRSDRLGPMGVYIEMMAALTETGICNTCIHIIRGELVIVGEPRHKSITAM